MIIQKHAKKVRNLTNHSNKKKGAGHHFITWSLRVMCIYPRQKKKKKRSLMSEN